MIRGVLWRAPGRGWVWRESLDGRTYPPGSVFVRVATTSRPRPIPKGQGRR